MVLVSLFKTLQKELLQERKR